MEESGRELFAILAEIETINGAARDVANSAKGQAEFITQVRLDLNEVERDGRANASQVGGMTAIAQALGNEAEQFCQSARRFSVG